MDGYIDAHVHLPDIAPGDGWTALARAKAAGVRRLVVCGTRPADWPLVRALAADEAVIPCFGLHPWMVAQYGDWRGELAEHLAAVPSGLGEIGLDRAARGIDYAQQEAAFIVQLRLARDLDRPAMVHCVRAWGRLVELLAEHAPDRFLLHAYAGSADLVPVLARRGAWFSFAGSVLHPGRDKARSAIQAVPPDRLLVETDAPALPLPGQAESRPEHLPAVVAGIADILGEDPESLRARLWHNACGLLGALLD